MAKLTWNDQVAPPASLKSLRLTLLLLEWAILHSPVSGKKDPLKNDEVWIKLLYFYFASFLLLFLFHANAA